MVRIVFEVWTSSFVLVWLIWEVTNPTPPHVWVCMCLACKWNHNSKSWRFVVCFLCVWHQKVASALCYGVPFCPTHCRGFCTIKPMHLLFYLTRGSLHFTFFVVSKNILFLVLFPFLIFYLLGSRGMINFYL